MIGVLRGAAADWKQFARRYFVYLRAAHRQVALFKAESSITKETLAGADPSTFLAALRSEFQLHLRALSMK